MSEKNHEPTDHGQVVQHPGIRISWAWLFPVLAALAAGWLFWSNWKANGPEITIEFDNVPGIQTGKTPLIYRGVVAGVVNRVHLERDLGKAVVTVRLKAFASGLAREGTLFWIDQPVIGLVQTSGIESLIQGNSIQARIGSGPPATRFSGSDEVPLTPLEEPNLCLHLKAQTIPFLDRGTPVYFRGVPVGVVEGKLLDSNQQPYLRVVIDDKFAPLVRSNARFWALPAASVKIGAGSFRVDMAGLKAFILGGIAFDYFGEQPAGQSADGETFELSDSLASARANGPVVEITFDDVTGIRTGGTELTHQGVPVGLVTGVQATGNSTAAIVTARFNKGFECLQTSGSKFTLVRPRISLEGVSGLETIVGGVYINCEPGQGPGTESRFAGRSNLLIGRDEVPGLAVELKAAEIPAIGKGAPVFLRGVEVGRITDKSFDEANRPVLKALIKREFAPLVTENARFWRLPAASVQAGPGILNMEIPGLEALWQGGVGFDVFGPAGTPVRDGAAFELFASEKVARADSPAIRITFDNGQGLLAGQTQIRYLGIPVGIVESVTTRDGKVTAVGRLNPGHDYLRRRGSIFSIVRPSISLEGVTGLEALVSGVYIECLPAAGGPPAEEFEGAGPAAVEAVVASESGFEVVLRSASSSVSPEAPVFYRGVKVGKIVRKSLSPDRRSADLIAAIDRPYAPLLRENTRFWDVSGVKASLGFFAIKVRTASVEALTLGGVEFATPEEPVMGPRVKPGHVFELVPSPRREWLRWAPAIPVTSPKPAPAEKPPAGGR